MSFESPAERYNKFRNPKSKSTRFGVVIRVVLGRVHVGELVEIVLVLSFCHGRGDRMSPRHARLELEVEGRRHVHLLVPDLAADDEAVGVGPPPSLARWASRASRALSASSLAIWYMSRIVPTCLAYTCKTDMLVVLDMLLSEWCVWCVWCVWYGVRQGSYGGDANRHMFRRPTFLSPSINTT